MGKRKEALVVAAVAGGALGVKAPAPEVNAGQPVQVKCYGINGCAAISSCAVKGKDVAAVKALLKLNLHIEKKLPVPFLAFAHASSDISTRRLRSSGQCSDSFLHFFSCKAGFQTWSQPRRKSSMSYSVLNTI